MAKKQEKNKENTLWSKNDAKISDKALSSGITQPHNAKKEALGRNTDQSK
ncbi:MAG: hypothetical protein FWG94_10110 [Oscillospiraceae bacterium]|nr:hypothetical protein [Oscillospiraceae bacterium]